MSLRIAFLTAALAGATLPALAQNKVVKTGPCEITITIPIEISGPKANARTPECAPSAPITTSNRRAGPDTNSAVTPAASWASAVTALPN